MKTLLVLRHAKSSWATDDADHDRPLNKRGLRDAPRMGRFIRQENLIPDLILSSTATRARLTTELVTEAADYRGPVQHRRELYHAEPAQIIEVLRVADANARAASGTARVMIVGHNPGLEEFIESMTGAFVELPTAALAQLEIPIDQWSDIALDGCARLAGIWNPKTPGK